jgi:hypothetical protein
VPVGCQLDGRMSRAGLRPGPGEGAGKLGVVGLEHDLPAVACLADDHTTIMPKL